MPTNKNAYMRYQILDRCFSDRRHRYNIDELNELVGERLGYAISRRQIREDIANMKLSPYNAPIEAYRYEGNKCYYRYSDPNYSIFRNELSTEELSHLRSTIEMLGRYRGTPANEWMEEVVSKLEWRFGVRRQTQNLISFDHNERLRGIEYLSPLIDATTGEETIEVDYKTFKGVERHCVVHPYYMKQYNGRWFLLGLNDAKQRIEIYALDRMESMRRSEVAFKENTTTDFNHYFNDIVGVSVPHEEVKTEKVVMRFSAERFPYVVSKPIHHSQQIEEEPYTISIRVKPTRELSQQIFSFIPDVEVVAPQWLREEIAGKIAENLKKYRSVKNECTDRM